MVNAGLGQKMVFCDRTKCVALVLFACFSLFERAQAIYLTQSEVDNWSSEQTCFMRMVLTNDGDPYVHVPDVVYDSALVDVGLYNLSIDIANLGLGYTAQEILDAFTGVIEQPPFGEVANGWSVSGRTEEGGFLLTHDSAVYDVWTSAAGSNDVMLTLSLDKKYLGPNATLALNYNVLWGFGFIAFDQISYYGVHTNTYQLVPEPGTLLLLLSGIALLSPSRKPALR